MKAIKKIRILLFFFLTSLLFTGNAGAQVFYIGVNGGAVYSWFDSPELDDIVSSDGWGWDLGFFLRYGKRPYFQVGFDWVRSNNNFLIKVGETVLADENINLHNFDFSLKIGYNILQTPMFKIKVHTGPFIGRSLLFSGEDILFDNSDFKNPQWGIIAGTGFQFTNLIVDFEYSYHFTELFQPIPIDGFEHFEFGSKLQLVSVKIGFMF
ncbi:MAG: hypothetical protein J7L04_05980 [Bacteroidales bacterium]|nr:hypothetical protein [Bacteroidales bacterium]